AGGALLPTRAKQSWPLMDGADGMDEGGGCGQRAAGRGGGERVGSDVGSWRGRGGGRGSVLVRGRGHGDDGRRCDARPAAGGLCRLCSGPWISHMARFRSEMGHDQSGMELNFLMTGEEDLPRVASVINVGLRPRQIWNVLVVAVVMNGLDRGKDRLSVVGSAAVATTASDGNSLAIATAKAVAELLFVCRCCWTA
ncbi:hypothetical protein ACLOJK_014967, partial [Asimina triloba]